MNNLTRSVVCLLTLVGAAANARYPVDDSTAAVYRLTAEASYQEGCFDPCLCPLAEMVAMRGTFSLGAPVTGDVVDFRPVDDINWTVGAPGDTLHTITGSGSYRVTNFGPPYQHALELTLTIDGGEPQSFFSDFQPRDQDDGQINLTVSMNGLFCYDIVLRVNAAPVPADAIRPLRLVPGSQYQEGCFDPGDCILYEPVPLRGRFGLVPLLDLGTFAEFALVQARFFLGDGAVDARPLAWTGFGTYTLIQGFAGPAHEITLTLNAGPDGPWVFTGGLDNTDAISPAIDIVADMNDQVCFDRVLTLRARPPIHALPLRVGDED